MYPDADLWAHVHDEKTGQIENEKTIEELDEFQISRKTRPLLATITYSEKRNGNEDTIRQKLALLAVKRHDITRYLLSSRGFCVFYA